MNDETLDYINDCRDKLTIELNEKKELYECLSSKMRQLELEIKQITSIIEGIGDLNYDVFKRSNNWMKVE